MKRSGPIARKSPLRKQSSRRQKEARLYTKKRKAFLEDHPYCEVSHLIWGGIPRWVSSTDIHHKAGRIGKNFLDDSTWMAVSREAHDWIHSHPKEARAKGWLI